MPALLSLKAMMSVSRSKWSDSLSGLESLLFAGKDSGVAFEDGMGGNEPFCETAPGIEEMYSVL